MALGLHAHVPHQRESLEPLIEQAFRTLSVLAIVLVVLGGVIAALYMYTG